VFIQLDFERFFFHNIYMMNDTRTTTIEDMQKQISDLLSQVKYLTEQNHMLRQRLFGRSSEKKMTVMTEGQMRIFNEAEQESDDTVPEPELEQVIYKRKKQKGKRGMDFAGLPVEQIIHELPENERVCPECGGMLHARGHDVLRRELTIIPAQYKVTEHVQTVYACRECEENGVQVPMMKAKVPAPVIPGSGIASPSLVAHIANQKYTLALPLYRQEQELSRNNLNVSRQTMANWLIFVAERWLVPIYNALKSILLLAHVLHADETSVQVLKEEGKPAESKSCMWMYRTGCDTDRPIVLYEYQSNHRHANAKFFLKGFSGYLHCDGYQAYDHLPPDITVVRCWAHVRRKFTDILKSTPDYNKPGSLATRGITYCDKLFDLEREYAKLPAADHFQARYEARLQKSKPIMDEFFDWVKSVYGKNILATSTSTMGIALAYALNQRTKLEHVLRDGRLELSNNRAERSIKPFVIGRKNWLFSNTEKGADASAMFYSVVETAKENRLKPYEYLKYIFATAPNLDLAHHPDSVERLLPWNVPNDCRPTTQLAIQENVQ
jgi:transposase